MCAEFGISITFALCMLLVMYFRSPCVIQSVGKVCASLPCAAWYTYTAHLREIESYYLSTPLTIQQFFSLLFD